MYKIDFNNFFTYAFSVDCVIFGYKEGKIHVLLIRRSMEPYDGHWAIPGDLVYPDEDITDAASRILSELTKIENLELHQSQTFGDPNRHPQGRVITTAYFALMRIDDFAVEASSWAGEARWVPIHEVALLAFDHNLILNSTYNLLIQKLRSNPICFDLLPHKFTLNEMQKLYEYAYDSDMDKANFRKKIKSIPLIEHEEKQVNVKHRPAKLFSFDEQEYINLLLSNEYQFKM
jgi:8-oxo-dGTP diphosphatase